MCSIIGYKGNEHASSVLVEVLERWNIEVTIVSVLQPLNQENS